MIKYRKYLLKLKDAFLEENVQNTKMLDLYLKYLEGEASEQDLEDANKQLGEILKSLGMGVLVVLPFSPVSIPYLVKKAKENNKIAGIHTGSTAYAKEMISLGFQFVTILSEFRFMTAYGESIINEMKNEINDNSSGSTY